MTEAEREFQVARIIAGEIHLHLYWDGDFRLFVVRKLTRQQVLRAEMVYRDACRDAAMAELMDEDEALAHLLENGLWDVAREKALDDFHRNVEKIKIGIYEKRHEPEVVAAGKRALAVTREQIGALLERRHSVDAMTCSGVARLARFKARLGMGLYRDEEPVFPGDAWAADECGLLDQLVSAWNDARLEDADFRELARNAPWRAIWQSRGTTSSLFGVAGVDYTDEQHNLVAASQLYEQIRQHPNCPSDYVLEDDDMLDGWLLLEHKKSAKDDIEKDIESTIRSDKIKQAQEVFKVVGKNKELADKVESLNSDGARKTIDRRFRAMEQSGRVEVADLPDKKEEIRMQLNQMEMQRRRGGSG